MIASWLGQTWGDGVDSIIQAAPGLEDWIGAAANVDGPFDGVSAAPMFRPAGGFVLAVVLFADSDAEMNTKLAALKAVTAGSTGLTATAPMTFTLKGEPTKTVFARVLSRQPATDFATADRYRACMIPITFEAPDPNAYGAQVTTALDVGEQLTIVGGWVPSYRWQWIAHGEATNPRITVETDGFDDLVLRFAGTVNDGQNLLVASTPSDLVTTVGGFNRYSDFDGGVHTVLPPDLTLIAGQHVTYSAGVGSGDASFSYWPAMP